MSPSLLRTIDELPPREFENFAFDLLQMIGMTTVVWRTPGADGGRDIDATYHARDASGYVDRQRWFVECKRYATSIDWPTLWAKLAYADNEGADFLLLVTNSNPSPQCENQIAQW